MHHLLNSVLWSAYSLAVLLRFFFLPFLFQIQFILLILQLPKLHLKLLLRKLLLLLRFFVDFFLSSLLDDLLLVDPHLFIKGRFRVGFCDLWLLHIISGDILLETNN